MNSNPKFSIITVCYNSEKTIGDTLRSIAMQSYTNWEYIIVDGNSGDNTVKICNQFKKQYEGKVRIISEKDNGPYDAMNKGIKMSSGDIIAVINSNDYWYDSKTLQKAADAAKGCMDDEFIIYGMCRILRDDKELEVSIYNINDIDNRMLHHPSVFVSSKVYKKIGSYDTQYKIIADYDFILRAKAAGIKFIPLYEILANFRVGGISSGQNMIFEKLKVQKRHGKISTARYFDKYIERKIAVYVISLGRFLRKMIRAVYHRLIKLTGIKPVKISRDGRKKVYKAVSEMARQFECNDAEPVNESVNIFIDNLRDEMLMLWLHRVIIARGMTDHKKGSIYMVSEGRCRFNENLYKKLSLKRVILYKRLSLANIRALFYAMSKTGSTGMDLINTTYKDMHIGELIYDWILSNSSDCTLDKITLSNGFKEIYHSIVILERLDKIFQRKSPDYYIVWDRGYNHGIAALAAGKYGAKIVEALSISNIKNIEDSKGSYTPYYHVYMHDKISHMLNTKEYGGLNNYDDISRQFAYASDKWNGKREDTAARLGLDKTKKNAAIFCHCLTDWVHCSEKQLFQDYYTWMRETLALIQSNNHVNWLVKPHPMRKFYLNENDIVNNAVKEYPADHVYIVSDDISTEAILDVSDFVITVTGTVGIEAAVKGIKTIVAGKAWYSGFGFTADPESIEEYKEMLSNIENLGRMTDEEILFAKKCYGCYKKERSFAYHDTAGRIFTEAYMDYYKKAQSFQMSNDALAESLAQETIHYRETEFYMKGKQIANHM